jgi:hypothetical protein
LLILAGSNFTVVVSADAPDFNTASEALLASTFQSNSTTEVFHIYFNHFVIPTLQTDEVTQSSASVLVPSILFGLFHIWPAYAYDSNEANITLTIQISSPRFFISIK